MSELKHEAAEQSDAEHGTVKSYVFGFILSLVFTFIPFYLVVSQAVTGTILFAIILVFAFLQMAIQLFFFLHLGRGPKPMYNVSFLLGTFAAILIVVGGSVYIMSHLHYNMSPEEKSIKLAEDEGIYQLNGKKTGACRGVYQNHKIIIRDGVVTPGFVEARQCETISFIKEDNIPRAIAFGSHPQHLSYAGETELKLHKNRANTITLNQLGTYQFHDHLNPETAGYFAVKPQ